MGKLFIVTGPSGAGKDSVIFKAKEEGLDFAQVVTTSSRPIRPGESEGYPYHFVSEEKFREMIAKGDFIEWAEVYGNFYGSTKQEVETMLQKNKVVILKIDPQGARTMKKMMPNTISIFVMPPSYEYLEKRLISRYTDTHVTIKKRLEVARDELKNLLDWDYLLVNDEGKLREAALELKEIIENNLQSTVLS